MKTMSITIHNAPRPTKPPLKVRGGSPKAGKQDWSYKKAFFWIASLALAMTAVFALGAKTAHASQSLQNPSNNLGLVFYAPMEEATGTIVGDFSGHGNKGTMTNMATPPTATSGWGAGKMGKGLTFDGSDDYVDIANVPLTQAANNTLSTWFKPTSLPASFSQKVLVSGKNSLSRMGLDNSAGTGTQIFAQFNDNRINGTTILNANTWYHIVAVHTGGNTYVYLNGVYENFGVDSDDSVSAQGFYIGMRGDSSQNFAGSIDDVRIYNRALSATEVASLYGARQVRKVQANNNGLVGYWNFEENAGTIANDSSGRGNTGTLISMASPPTATSGWGAGKFGKGLNFDGSNDTVVGPHISALESGDMTFSTWVKPNNFSLAMWIARQRNTASSTGPMLNVIATSGRVRFGIGNNILSDSSLTAGAWSHVVGVALGTNMSIYINGTLDKSATITRAESDTSSLFRISSNSNQEGYEPFNGSIDDVRIYNRALSAAEVATLYSAGQTRINAPNNNGLVGYWNFEENAGTIAGDSSGRGNKGTLTNMEATDWVGGKFGKALSFDGSSDYVIVTDQASLDLVNTATWTAWVKLNVNNTTQTLLNKDATGVDAEGWAVYISSSGKLTFYQQDGGNTPANTTISTGAWHHVTVTKTGSTVTYYLDGVADGTPSGYVTAILTNSLDLGIGAKITGPTEFLNGSIDDVRIYNRALSASEVSALYNVGR